VPVYWRQVLNIGCTKKTIVPTFSCVRIFTAFSDCSLSHHIWSFRYEFWNVVRGIDLVTSFGFLDDGYRTKARRTGFLIQASRRHHRFIVGNVRCGSRWIAYYNYSPFCRSIRLYQIWNSNSSRRYVGRCLSKTISKVWTATYGVL
jgi:hypothetical protein